MPRPCPCLQLECQKIWHIRTVDEESDDDEIYRIKHCMCHTIGYDHKGHSCWDCGQWMCIKCKHFASETRQVLCFECCEKRYQSELDTLQKQMDVLKEQLQHARKIKRPSTTP